MLPGNKDWIAEAYKKKLKWEPSGYIINEQHLFTSESSDCPTAIRHMHNES